MKFTNLYCLFHIKLQQLVSEVKEKTIGLS